ncbi:MAG: hypothetical protein ACNA7W_15335, partial [Pseudomonadales bacterium]
MSLLLMFVLVGCGSNSNSGSSATENNQTGSNDGGSVDNDDADDGSDASDGGVGAAPDPDLNYAQKGPFSPGAEVTAIRLDEGGERTSDVATTPTGNNGSFEFPTLPWSGPTLVEVTGTYFNEATGNFSNDAITLQAMMQAEDGAIKGNINLFTHLLAARIKYFQREDGRSFDDALARALNDFDFWFGGKTNPILLNLLEAPTDEVLAIRSGALLLFSAAFLELGFEQAQLEAMREEFADDFPDDEDGAGYQIYARIGAELIDSDVDIFGEARERLIAQYSSNPPTALNLLSLVWTRNGCEFSNDLGRLCVGLRRTFEVEARGSANLFFDMPSSGSVTVDIRGHRNTQTNTAVQPGSGSGWTLYKGFDEFRSPPHFNEVASCTPA